MSHTIKLEILEDATLARLSADYFRRLADLSEDAGVEVNWPHDRENMEILVKALERECKKHHNVKIFTQQNSPVHS